MQNTESEHETGCWNRISGELALLKEDVRKVKLEKHSLQKQIDEKFNKQVRPVPDPLPGLCAIHTGLKTCLPMGIPSRSCENKFQLRRRCFCRNAGIVDNHECTLPSGFNMNPPLQKR